MGCNRFLGHVGGQVCCQEHDTFKCRFVKFTKSLYSAEIIWDGRLYKSAYPSVAAFDTPSAILPTNGVANPTTYAYQNYISKSNGTISTSLELSTKYRNRKDRVSEQGVGVTVDNSSVWWLLPQNVGIYRRVELVPNHPDVKTLNASTVPYYYHVSMMMDADHPLEPAADHDILFHERDADWLCNFGLSFGGKHGNKLVFFTDDENSTKGDSRTVRWSSDLKAGVWYNFVFTFDLPNKCVPFGNTSIYSYH